MSFSYLKKKFKKKGGGKKAKNAKAGVNGNAALVGPRSTAEEEARRKEQEEMITQVMNRINEIENDIPRIKVSMDTLKSQINELREEIERLDKVIKDVMVLYEIVSQQINPFKDANSGNPLLSEIQELREEINNLKGEIAQIKADLRLLIIDGMDLDDLIYEVISEGGV
ncbi:flagella accessory protein C [Thermococcus sp.]